MRRIPLQRIRLSDLPFEVRVAAARREARTASDAEEASGLLLAALFPSDKIYFVRADAEPDVELRAA
jgi:hypothetical protein